MENKKKIKGIKKLLFITPRNPFSGRFSGDVIRAKKICQYLKKKFSVTILTLDEYITSQKKIENFNLITFKEKNIVIKFLNIIKFLLKLKPMQLGYFYSNDWIWVQRQLLTRWEPTHDSAGNFRYFQQHLEHYL